MNYKCIIFSIGADGHTRTLGAHRIATVLRDNSWDAEVVDFAFLWKLSELKLFAASRIDEDTKFIAFSNLFSTTWSPVLEEFCAWLRKTFPNVILISGSGVDPVINSSHIHYYIRGYGEYAIMELLKYLFSNGPSPKFELAGKKIIAANTFYPAYPLSSLNVRYEDRDHIQPFEWLGVELARGCKFQCAFCDSDLTGMKGDATRDADDFVTQLKDAYDRFGVSHYFVSDETFNDRTEKITKFANAVQELDFNPTFAGYIRADLMNSRSEDREELLRMNFLFHVYGIETFNHESGKVIGKGMEPTRMKEGLLATKEYFEKNGSGLYRGSISLIFGLPHETMDTLEESKRWIFENWQGQSVMPHELFIWAEQKRSKMSIDYSRYGYTTIDPNDERHALYNSLPIKKDFGTPVLWKNPHMDYFDVIQYGIQYRKDRDAADFRLGAFDLAYLHTHDIQQRLAVSKADKVKASVTKQLIKEYIQRKIDF